MFKSECSSITFTYKWTIENYSRLYEKDNPWKWRICSNEFSPPNNQDLQFEIHLYPKGINNKDYESLGVRVFDIPHEFEGKIQCRWNVKIEGENEVKCATEEKEIYHLYRREWKILNIIDDKQLLNFPSKLPNDQLTLYFEIHLQAKKDIFNVIPKKMKKKKLNMSKFDCANKVTRMEHIWTIDNFNQLFTEMREAPYFIQSDHFSAPMQREQFCLRLCPNGWSEKWKDNIEIFIWNDNEERANVHYRACILGLDGKKYLPRGMCTQIDKGQIEACMIFFTVDTEKIPSKYGRSFRFNRTDHLKNLEGLAKKKILEDNKLRIYIDMFYMMDSTENKGIPNTESNESNNELNVESNTESNTDSDSVFKSESSFDVASKTVRFVKKQFPDLYHKSRKNCSIVSQIFEFEKDTRIKFHLRLCPNVHDKQNSNKYLALELYNKSHCRVTAQYRVSILDAQGKQWNRWGDQSTIPNDGNVRRSKFFLQPRFYNSSLFRYFLPKGILTIVCEIWIVQDREIYDTIDPPSPQHQSTSVQSLVNNTSTSSAVLNLSNANLQGAIVNVLGELSVNHFNANLTSSDNKLEK